MMKTLYAASLYLLITCLTSVNGLDGPLSGFKLQSVAFNTCITFQDTGIGPSLSVVYLDCKFNLTWLMEINLETIAQAQENGRFL